MTDLRYDLKFLDVSVIRKLHDSNNVMVSFMDSKIEPVILGRKQLVLLLEKIAQDPYLHQFEGLRAHAARNAADARQHLWPKSLL